MSFTYAFYQHIMFRHSCGVCHYCNTRRPSDITIADFWGWEKTNPTFNLDDKGVSLLLINTEKGRRLFEAVKGDLDYFPAELKNVLQTHLRKPSDIHPDRVAFEQLYVKRGFVAAMRRYSDIGWRFQVSQLKKRLKGKIKGAIKKIAKL